jgi:hypothetical protein
MKRDTKQPLERPRYEQGYEVCRCRRWRQELLPCQCRGQCRQSSSQSYVQNVAAFWNLNRLMPPTRIKPWPRMVARINDKDKRKRRERRQYRFMFGLCLLRWWNLNSPPKSPGKDESTRREQRQYRFTFGYVVCSGGELGNHRGWFMCGSCLV